MSNPRITSEQRNNLIALLMQQGNDRPTACIILDAREAAAERNGRNRCLDHATAARTHVSAVTQLREARADLQVREMPVNSGMHEYRVSDGAWMSAPALVTALGLDRA